jgi:hypothetical protein
MVRSKLFRKLNIISHTVYESIGQYVVWKNNEREEQLYVVKEASDKFDIYDPDKIMLASDMAEDMVINFIEADMNIGSPIPDSHIVSMGGDRIDTIGVNPEISTKTEKIIAAAAKRNGMESTGSSLLRELAARKETNKRTSGMVKKKRKFDISDLDLEDDE